MEKRSLFDKMLGRFMKPVINASSVQLMEGVLATFSSFGDNPYASDTVRTATHSIASNAAKLKARHVRRVNGDLKNIGGNLEYLLSVRPNPHMSAYDFIYKIVSQLLNHNNSFILIQNGLNGVEGFYPINFYTVELQEYKDELYVKFRFMNGKDLVVHYDDVIHLRRFYNGHDLFGEDNSEALLPTLELMHTTNEGVANAVKSSAKLRGLIKFTNSMLKPEDIKAQRDAFVADYLNVTNQGGIAALDAKAEYVELKTDPKIVDHETMTFIEEKIYKYFNINKAIVTSDYNEDQWNAFYESVLEPIAIQLSLEFTSKLFTAREKKLGHEIIFEANRLQYASASTKINLVNTLMPLGLLSMNEAREIFNLSPIEGGEKRLVSLNYVDADKANKYQVGEDDKNLKGGETDDKEQNGKAGASTIHD